MGFNRASLGAQSFDDEELQLLGRVHNTEDIYKTYDDICAAGFENINIDLMFGLPIGNLSSWMKSVDAALYLQTKHLTAYYWFMTRGSDFFNKIKEGLLRLPDREVCIEQYRYAINAAKKHGFRLYFDYNFSHGTEHEYAIERDMFRLFPLRGFGPGAWSQEGITQTWNPTRLQNYFKDPSKKWKREFTIDDYMMRVLMYPQGMVFDEFEQFFKIRWYPELMSEKMTESFKMWVENKFVEIDDTGIRFKEKTWEQSAIYLAELQTKTMYCP
jgi:coproporphyrinogen III oxidase-like Fe-S oxidoreductase